LPACLTPAEYNQEPPHSSLGYRTPAEFASEAATGCRKDGGYATLENVAHFPLSHSHDGGSISNADSQQGPEVVL